MESSEKNDAGSVNFQATEEETWRLLPENRNSKAVKVKN